VLVRTQGSRRGRAGGKSSMVFVLFPSSSCEGARERKKGSGVAVGFPLSAVCCCIIVESRATRKSKMAHKGTDQAKYLSPFSRDPLSLFIRFHFYFFLFFYFLFFACLLLLCCRASCRRHFLELTGWVGSLAFRSDGVLKAGRIVG
jgi:hypothetical protein